MQLFETMMTLSGYKIKNFLGKNNEKISVETKVQYFRTHDIRYTDDNIRNWWWIDIGSKLTVADVTSTDSHNFEWYRRAIYNGVDSIEYVYIGSRDGENNDYFESIADNEAFIPETVLQDREKVRLIKEIIDNLSDIQRLCVIGFYYNEQKQDEIARKLGIPVNTVKSHLFRN